MILRKLIEELPWALLIIAAVTLGLAPFSPPHLFEKLNMLKSGELIKPMDWFDFIMHGAPWALIFLKAMITLKK